MGRKKPFDVHDLYPDDYYFDWETFESNPEGYVFTKEDIAFNNAIELERYEATVPMTPHEKRALRKWVMSGHSVNEAPPSKYCLDCRLPAPDFLEVYRTDKELDAATKGMTKAQRLAYLKDYFGFQEESEEDRRLSAENERLHKLTPPAVHKRIQSLNRQLFYVWEYLSEKGLMMDAEKYVQDHMDSPVVFEEDW